MATYLIQLGLISPRIRIICGGLRRQRHRWTVVPDTWQTPYASIWWVYGWRTLHAHPEWWSAIQLNFVQSAYIESYISIYIYIVRLNIRPSATWAQFIWLQGHMCKHRHGQHVCTTLVAALLVDDWLCWVCWAQRVRLDICSKGLSRAQTHTHTHTEWMRTHWTAVRPHRVPSASSTVQSNSR